MIDGSSAQPSGPSSADLSPYYPESDSAFGFGVVSNILERLMSDQLKRDSHWEPSGRYNMAAGHRQSLVHVSQAVVWQSYFSTIIIIMTIGWNDINWSTLGMTLGRNIWIFWMIQFFSKSITLKYHNYFVSKTICRYHIVLIECGQTANLGFTQSVNVNFEIVFKITFCPTFDVKGGLLQD